MVSKDSVNMTQSPVKASSLSIKTSSTHESSEKASQRTTATLQKIKQTKCNRQRRVLILAFIAALLGLIVIGLVTHTAIKASAVNKLKASGQKPVTGTGAGENVSGDTIKKGEDLSDMAARHGASGKSPISDPTAVQETKGKSLSSEKTTGSYWPSLNISQNKLGYALSAVAIVGMATYAFKDCFASAPPGAPRFSHGTDMSQVAETHRLERDLPPQLHNSYEKSRGRVAVVEVWPRNIMPFAYTYEPKSSEWVGVQNSLAERVSPYLTNPSQLSYNGGLMPLIGAHNNVDFTGEYSQYANAPARIRAGGSSEIIDVLKDKWGTDECLPGPGASPVEVNTGLMAAALENGWAVERVGPLNSKYWDRAQCPAKRTDANFSRMIPYIKRARQCREWDGPILIFKVFKMIE